MADGAVLVAGATGGVGTALCRRLGALGRPVGIAYRSSAERAAALQAELGDQGVECWTVQADLTDPDQARHLVDEAPQLLTGVVYAAGPPVRLDYASRLTPANFAEVVDSDLKACFHLFQAAIAPLRESGGALLAVSTVAVSRYATRDVLSAVPKAGVETLVKAIAVEEGRFGIRANVVAPGLLEGDGMIQTFQANGHFGAEAMDVARRATPLRRFGRPEDIARAAAFLLSSEASWITGQVLCVDGGYSVA